MNSSNSNKGGDMKVKTTAEGLTVHWHNDKFAEQEPEEEG